MKISQKLWEVIKNVPELEHLQNDWKLLPNTILDFKNNVDSNYFYFYDTCDIKYKLNNLVIEYEFDFQFNYNGRYNRLHKSLHGKCVIYFDDIGIEYYWRSKRLK